MEMNAQYFIDKFEAIPEDRWTTGYQVDDNGRRCAVGHFLPDHIKTWNDWHSGTDFICGSTTNEGKACMKVISLLPAHREYISAAHFLAEVNNGCVKKYQQDSPKQRTLAVLRDCLLLEQQQKAVEEVQTIVNQPDESK